jgi:hypothetical protein
MNEQQLNYLNIWRHDTKQDHHFTVIQCRYVECHYAECRGAEYFASLFKYSRCRQEVHRQGLPAWPVLRMLLNFLEDKFTF